VRRTISLSVVIVTILATMAPIAAHAQTPDGQEIFGKRCARCHQKDGRGVPNKYPPLAGNPEVADHAYVVDVVTNGLEGKEIMGVAYDRKMPAFGKRLSKEEIDAVASYVVELSKSAPPPTPTTTIPAGAASAATGENLFTGNVPLKNGGPACIACHAAGSYDRLGGPGMGPNLTGVADAYGQGDLAAAIADPPWDPMVAVFGDRPITAKEANDVAAFLATTSGTSGATGGVDLLIAFGIAGLILLFLFTLIVVRGPQRLYVQKLRSTR